MDDVSQELASAFQLHQAGQLPEAERLYRDILARQPAYHAALHLLALVAWQQGRAAEAVDTMSRATATAPREARYLTDLGFMHASLQQWEPAADSLRRAVAIDPNSAIANSNLGVVERNLGQLDRAAASFERAVALNPGHAEAHNNLGSIRKDLGQLESAERCYRDALSLQPGYALAHCNLGSVLQALGRPKEALACYEQALRFDPQLALAHNNRGTALCDLGRSDEALACYEQALQFDPQLAMAHNNLGNAWKERGQLDAAERCYSEAIRLQPDYPEAHYNRAFVFLTRGEYTEGWASLEWRMKCNDYRGPRFREPQWDGSELAGRKLLIHAEQGLGDTVQFVRYAQRAHELGGRVTLQCQPALARLLKGCRGVEQVVPFGDPLPSFDVQASLLSMPHILGTTLDTVPHEVPYLDADPQLVEQWRQRLEAFEGFKIGIVWRGNPKYPLDRFRSIPLSDFQPLAEVPGVRLFSIQKGLGTEQIAAAKEQVPLIDLDPEIDRETGAFMDTAAVMMNLDLVVACDSAIAHLAGALGVRVWVALPVASDWRWLLDREDSPWYPTVRLFRQQKPVEWDEVFRRMAAAAAPLVAQ